MPSAAGDTLIKMIEALPEELQDHVLEHVREYIEELTEEARWAESFSRSQEKLIAAARRARREVSEGKAEPLDIEKL